MIKFLFLFVHYEQNKETELCVTHLRLVNVMKLIDTIEYGK